MSKTRKWILCNSKFLGFKSCLLIKLTDNLKVCPAAAINGFFCDWENRKEYDMLNFIAGLIE